MPKLTTSFDSREDRLSIPWLKRSNYTSTDKNNPDKIEIKVVETEPFETRHGRAVKVLVKKGSEWVLHYLGLKDNGSRNDKLDFLWDTNEENGRIRLGVEFVLRTWLRKSMTSDWQIRDYAMDFKGDTAMVSSLPSISRKRKGGDKDK